MQLQCTVIPHFRCIVHIEIQIHIQIYIEIQIHVHIYIKIQIQIHL